MVEFGCNSFVKTNNYTFNFRSSCKPTTKRSSVNSVHQVNGFWYKCILETVMKDLYLL